MDCRQLRCLQGLWWPVRMSCEVSQTRCRHFLQRCATPLSLRSKMSQTLPHKDLFWRKLARHSSSKRHEILEKISENANLSQKQLAQIDPTRLNRAFALQKSKMRQKRTGVPLGLSAKIKTGRSLLKAFDRRLARSLEHD